MNWRFWDRTGGAGGDGCAAMEPLLSLYSDGMASPAEARRVGSHLQHCPGCRQALGWMQATRRVIAARPAVPPPADLRSRIARAISEADRIPAPILKAPARRPLTLRPALAYGLSFALLAALSGSLFWNADHLATSAPHPAHTLTVVAARPADTVKSGMPMVRPHPRPKSTLVAVLPPDRTRPDVGSNDVAVPHFTHTPSVHIHLPQPKDVPDFTNTLLGNADLAPAKPKTTSKPVTAPVHHPAPHGALSITGNEHLAKLPVPATVTPPKESPLTTSSTQVATNNVPPPPSMTPEPAPTPRVIITPPVIIPEPRPEVHEASLGETLRDSVRHMQHTPLTYHSFKLSSTVVEAAGVSSDRSATAPAVGAGF